MSSTTSSSSDPCTSRASTPPSDELELELELETSDSKPLPPGPPRSPLFSRAAAERITVRSADGAEFHMSRQFLADASPVLEDMATYPPVPPATSVAIDLPETGEAAETLLLLCHPLAPALHCPTLDVMKGALALLWAYELRGSAGWRVGCALGPWLETVPVRVYVFAVEKGDLALMAAAAKASLRFAGTLVDHEELDAISTHAYRRLLAYREACAAKVACLASYKAVNDSKWVWKSCRSCSSTSPLFPSRYGWFSRFYAKLDQALQTTPHPDAVKAVQRSEMDDALKEAGHCDCTKDVRCGARAWKELPCFLDEVASEVDRRISEVAF